MRSSYSIQSGLCFRLIFAFFLILNCSPQLSQAAHIGSTADCLAAADGDAVATLLTLPCGGQVIQITDAQPGINGGGNATAETRTVYSFSPDNANGIPTYEGSAWPYIIVTGSLSADEEISAALTLNEAGVLLINGWPAYQFIGDGNSTDINGVYGPWFYFLPNGNPSSDACIEIFDCPELSANIGDSCDDGDPSTFGDTIQDDCNCVGMSQAPGSISISADWSIACGSRPVAISLYEVGTAIDLYAFQLEIDEDGFVQTDEVPSGNYDVIIKIQGFLAVGFANFAVESGNTPLEIASITGGDINNNNSVNVSDISSLSAAFGSITTDENYNSLGDLNCNGIINIVDVSSLSSSFGMVGVSAPLN